MIERDLRQISSAQGTVIFELGAVLDTISFPLSGMISLTVVTEDGGIIETSTVGREGAVGLHGVLGHRLSFTRATTQISGVFSTIPTSRFRSLIDGNVSVLKLITDHTELLLAEAQQVAACNAVHDASSRLCRWLLQAADRIGSDVLSLTQEFLAQMLGVRRTTLTLLAQDLQRKGLIQYSRGQITILDRKGLEENACECHHILRYKTLLSMIGLSA